MRDPFVVVYAALLRWSMPCLLSAIGAMTGSTIGVGATGIGAGVMACVGMWIGERCARVIET